MENFNEDLKNRTKKLAVRVIKMYAKFKKDEIIKIIGNQFIRSSTSVAANYRAACRARGLQKNIILNFVSVLKRPMRYCFGLKY